MEEHKNTSVALTGRLAEFRQALEDEIDIIEKSGQSSTLLFGGRRIESPGVEFWYRFHIEYLPVMPADTPCKLVVGKDSYNVTVISFEESFIVIASQAELPYIIAKARLENGTKILMERLIKRIEASSIKANPVGERIFKTSDLLLTDTYTCISNDTDFEFEVNNSGNQNKAITSALTNNITYIWGPPGTGKTMVIGQIIKELLRRNRSALLVSHTNTAVDGAIKIVDIKYDEAHRGRDEMEPYPILRMGNPSIPLEDRIQIKAHISILGKELYARKVELDNQKAEHQKRLNIIIPLINKSKWAQQSRLEYAHSLLSNIDQTSGDVQVLLRTQNDVFKKLKTAESEYTQCREYKRAQEDLSRKEHELNDLQSRIDKAQSDLEFIPGRIQAAKDEIVKHEKYTELKAIEARQLSIPAQKNQIIQIKAQLERLQREEQSLTDKNSFFTQKINEYNQKGTFAKLLAGKNSIAHAIEASEVINKRLPEIYALIKAKALTLQDYENQLIKSLAIQEQLNAITIRESKEDWQREILLMTELIKRSQNELPDLQKELSQIKDKLPDLHDAFNTSKKVFDAILKIKQKLDEISAQIRHKQGTILEKKSECTDVLENESLLCASFGFNCNGTELTTIYNSLSNLIQQVNAELSSVDIPSLETEEQEIREKIIKLLEELSDIDQKMRELEIQAVIQAKVIGTTLAKSYLSDILQERTFDTVIVDEASMASIPALWCASYLAEKNIVIIGDFKQLPPIVMAKTPMAQKWLGSDIFLHSGMQAKLGKGKPPPENLAVLDEQFRMESEIANIASRLYYEKQGVHLQSHDDNEERCKVRDEFYQWYAGEHTKHCIHLIDTKNLHAWVTGVPQGKSHSRLNCFSTILCVDLAFRLLENKLEECKALQKSEPAKKPFVLIVAPYKPHVTRINQLIDLEYHDRGFQDKNGDTINLNLIQAGTIHSFQGNEADIVIFDLVVDEPHWKANLFMLDEKINSDMEKMFNVAITRVKFKLFIIGNFSYCQKRAKNNALGILLHMLIDKEKLPVLDAKALFPKLPYVPKGTYAGEGDLSSRHIICREDTFYDYFQADILKCQKKLIVYSPFMAQERISSLLPYFAETFKKCCSITVITKALSERGKNEFAHYQKCEKELSNLGIKIIHKKGMHEKLIFIDDTIVWMGSLNVLSFAGFTGEIMHRHCDTELAEEYAKMFDIKHLVEVAQNTVEQICPICGSEILAAESDSGGFYWTCVNKDYTRQPTQQYPSDGILRCKCGAPYIFSMKN